MRKVVVIAVIAAACGTRAPDKAAPANEQTTERPAPAERDGLFADVEAICFAEQRSGAMQEDENRRSMIVATWLADQVRTQDGRELLGEIGRLAPADKAARLRRAATDAGLDGCPTADSWGK